MPQTSEQVRDHLARVLSFVEVRSVAHDGGASLAVAKALFQLVDDPAVNPKFMDLVHANEVQLAGTVPTPVMT
jgi:hypothetical protein